MHPKMKLTHPAVVASTKSFKLHLLMTPVDPTYVTFLSESTTGNSLLPISSSVDI